VYYSEVSSFLKILTVTDNCQDFMFPAGKRALEPAGNVVPAISLAFYKQ
jgi:hypothetical protein